MFKIKKKKEHKIWHIGSFVWTGRPTLAGVWEKPQPTSALSGFQSWWLLAGGQRWAKAGVQIQFLFSAWLHCNFLGFGDQDTLPCAQENSSDAHLAAACGPEIKSIHSTLGLESWPPGFYVQTHLRRRSSENS